jgi:hypothetical protein
MLDHDKQGAREANAGAIAKAKARGSASQAAAGNSVNAHNGAPVPVLATPTIITLGVITPRVSGRLKVTATYELTSDGGVVHTTTPQLGYKLTTAGLYTIFNSMGADTIPAAATTEISGTIQGVVSGLVPGLAYDIALILSADAPGHLTVPTSSGEIDIQEMAA